MTKKINKENLPAEVVQDILDLEDSYDELVEDAQAIAKALEEAHDTIAKQETELVKHGVSKGDPLEDVLAKADPAVAEVIKAQASQLQEQQEAIAKAQRDQLDREMVAKAEALPFITAEIRDLADVLRVAYEVPTPVAKEGEQQVEPFGDRLVQILTAANNQLMEGDLYKSFGASGGEATVSKSVEGRAEELMKADPTMDIHTARAKVYEDNPDLYEESLKEG